MAQAHVVTQAHAAEELATDQRLGERGEHGEHGEATAEASEDEAVRCTRRRGLPREHTMSARTPVTGAWMPKYEGDQK